MDVQRAIDDAAKGKVLPVYVIHGSERLLVTRAVEALRKATVGGGPRGLAEDHYEAGEIKPARVLDTARSLPMMSKWRFVLVRSLGDWKADELEQLLPYIDKPTPSTVLVLLADKLDGRTRFATTLKKKGVLFAADPPAERDLVPWVEAEAKRRGASFSQGAAASLVLTIGADLGALSDALDRLQLFASGRAITEQDVDQTVAPLREASTFDLPEAVADKNLPRALGLVHQLGKQREAGLLVLAMVARQVRILSRARDALDRGEDLGSVLRLPPFIVGKVAQQARRWTGPQLARALRICARADARFKSGGGRDREARLLEELVLALAGGPGMGELPLAHAG